MDLWIGEKENLVKESQLHDNLDVSFFLFSFSSPNRNYNLTLFLKKINEIKNLEALIDKFDKLDRDMTGYEPRIKDLNNHAKTLVEEDHPSKVLYFLIFSFFHFFLFD